MSWLNRGRTLVSNVTERAYKVTSHRVAQGASANDRIADTVVVRI